MAETLLITALFNDRELAHDAAQGVIERGYGRDEVNFIMAEDGQGLIAIGALAAGLSGAGFRDTSSGLLGSLLGAMRGWGLPDETVEAFEQGLHDGGALLAVRPHDDADAYYLERLWRALHARLIHTLS